MISYFTLFKIPKSFGIDLDLLEDKYLRLQASNHPDKAVSEDGKIEKLKISADINHAYQILKSDMKRAEYLLEIEGVRANKESNNTYATPQKLLIEQMELRERVFDTEKDKILEIQKEVKEHLKAVKGEFSSLYSACEYESASEKVVEMSYLTKLLEEIKKLKKLKRAS